jgi:chaperonin cofactor prefoldin
MAEASQHTNPDELRSDLDLLIEMAKDVEHDEQAIRRHLDSLKAKLDKFIHKGGTHSGGGSAS